MANELTINDYAAERRRYAVLNAAAILLGSGRNIRAEAAVDDAEEILAEVERREKS